MCQIMPLLTAVNLTKNGMSPSAFLVFVVIISRPRHLSAIKADCSRVDNSTN